MFSWGDYIAQVWDLWYADPNGILFVADLRERKKNNGDKKKSNSPIAVSHVAICPGKERIWLEGIRVHPSYRRSKVATHIIREMLQYGKKQGAKEASAIVATNNIASQLMLKKNGFKIISRWQYYSVSYKINRISRRRIDTRIASLKDVDNIWDYLRSSKIYRLSGRRYVSAWRWYLLDYNTLADFVKEQRLIITGYPFTDGVAIINKSGYWHRRGVLQIIYLDRSY